MEAQLFLWQGSSKDALLNYSLNNEERLKKR